MYFYNNHGLIPVFFQNQRGQLTFVVRTVNNVLYPLIIPSTNKILHVMLKFVTIILMLDAQTEAHYYALGI